MIYPRRINYNVGQKFANFVIIDKAPAHSKKHYGLDNVVSCCGTCNRAKSDMSKEEFLNWVEKVYIQNVK